jgi:hypothetical protein
MCEYRDIPGERKRIAIGEGLFSPIIDLFTSIRRCKARLKAVRVDLRGGPTANCIPTPIFNAAAI